MPRKKIISEEELEQNVNLDQTGGTAGPEEGAGEPVASETGFSEIPPNGEALPEDLPAEYTGVSEELLSGGDGSFETDGSSVSLETGGDAAEEPASGPLPADIPEEPVELPSGGRADHEDASFPPPPPEKSDRQSFYELNFNEMDRGLTAEERQEWNSIYASYRGRSALSGKIIGVDPLTISVRNRQTGELDRQTMYCAVVVPYRVRIVIPASEMWESGQERPDFVLQNMVGANIDFIIIKVDRESGFAIASRRMAARSQRYYFSHRPALQREGARAKCRVLSVGPRRCLVECFGHDINLTQRDLRYTAIPDLRNAYHPGEELDCIVKSYDAGSAALRISVKETESNPFEGAELRHPVGSRRQAAIAGKYGGGVFCNLPDGTVCMCSYSYQHEDADFMVGDTVILVVQRYDAEKRQMYGKILSKW